MAENYDADQFDIAAAKRRAVGVHREVKRSHAWLIALILVLLLAPLAGWGVGILMGNARQDSQVDVFNAPQQAVVQPAV